MNAMIDNLELKKRQKETALSASVIAINGSIWYSFKIPTNSVFLIQRKVNVAKSDNDKMKAELYDFR